MEHLAAHFRPTARSVASEQGAPAAAVATADRVDKAPFLTRATLRVPVLPRATARAARAGTPPPPLMILEVVHDLPGIYQVTVETRRGAVTVAFDAREVDLAAVRATLARAGFPTPAHVHH